MYFLLHHRPRTSPLECPSCPFEQRPAPPPPPYPVPRSVLPPPYCAFRSVSLLRVCARTAILPCFPPTTNCIFCICTALIFITCMPRGGRPPTPRFLSFSRRLDARWAVPPSQEEPLWPLMHALRPAPQANACHRSPGAGRHRQAGRRGWGGGGGASGCPGRGAGAQAGRKGVRLGWRGGVSVLVARCLLPCLPLDALPILYHGIWWIYGTSSSIGGGAFLLPWLPRCCPGGALVFALAAQGWAPPSVCVCVGGGALCCPGHQGLLPPLSSAVSGAPPSPLPPAAAGQLSSRPVGLQLAAQAAVGVASGGGGGEKGQTVRQPAAHAGCRPVMPAPRAALPAGCRLVLPAPPCCTAARGS